MRDDFRSAGLEERLVRMLEFVEKLTQAPHAIEEEDVEGLRGAGYDDVGVLHVVLGSSHFSYLNRVADGIGIPIDYAFEPATSALAEGGALAEAGRRADRRAADPERIAWIEAAPAQRSEGSGRGPSNLWRAIGANAAALELARAWRAYHLRATPGLDARLRAAAALISAGLAGCAYSARWFRDAFEREGGAAADADRLEAGEVPASAPATLERAALEHARRLTLAPWTTRAEHVGALRAAGLDDREILRLTALVAYVSFEVRVALGLGVALEPPG
ncbi:MAG: hypothetical protein IT372_12080 [Polyangiaceae bacterium]|nr:hypothetical protein [Polyangiaceae bacterium]